jgi:autotransporter-associated beta strand protein
LTVNGNTGVTFAGAVGGATALTSLDVTGVTTMNGSTINTTGAQTYHSAVNLGAGITLASTTNNIHFTSTISNLTAQALSISGATVTLDGAIGNGTALTSINVTGTTAFNGGTITTTGAQAFNSALTLGATTALNGGAITAAAIDNGGFDLTVNNSGTSSISGILSNSGNLIKSGAGTLTLSAANTYTGTTTINAGSLNYNTIGDVGTNTALGNTSSAINLGAGTLRYTGAGNTSGRVIALSASGATITSSGTGTLTLSGGVTGSTDNLTLSGSGTGIESGVINTSSGTLTKAGSGTWTLSGNNSYSGITTITTGTLQIGNSGTSGTLGTASVTDNGILTFNRTDTVTIANAISGTGTLTQAGTGTTILTSNNSYASTSITAGTLQIGNGSTTGTLGTGNVTDSSALVFDRSDTPTVANTISGTGTLTQAGSGTLTVSGTNSYSGGTNVNTGILDVTNASGLGGSANGGSVTVTSGAELNVDVSGSTLGLANASTVSIAGTGVGSTGAIDFISSGTLSNGISLTADAAIDYSATANSVLSGTINGTHALTIAGTTDGSVTLGNAIGNSQALTTLTTNANGTTFLSTSGTITTTSNQTYNGVVTLGADNTLNAGLGNVTFGNTLNGAHNLTISNSGTLSFANSVGGTTALTSLNATATTAIDIDGSVVNTTGNQSYTGGVTIQSAVAMNATAAGSVTLQSVDSNVAGTNSLAVNTNTGAINLNGNVGSNFALNNFSATTANNSISVNNNISTSGTANNVALTAGGAGNTLTIGGSATVTSGTMQYIADHMTLTGSTVLTSSGDITLRPFTNSYGTQVGSGATNVSTLGLSTTELNTITGSGSIIIGSGPYIGNISIVGDLITSNRAFNLTTTGTVTVANPVGSNVTPVTSLDVTGSTIDFGSNIFTTSGTFHSAVTLTGTGDITDSGSTTFDSTINGDGVSNRDLTVLANNIFVDGNVGNSVRPNNVVFNSTVLNTVTASSIKTNAGLSFTGNVSSNALTLDSATGTINVNNNINTNAGDLTVASGSANFGGTITATGANLILNNTNGTTFSGDVGSPGARLASFANNNGSTETYFNASLYTTGQQTHSNVQVDDANVTLDSSGGNISVGSIDAINTNASTSVAINTSLGAVNLNGTQVATALQPLASFAIDSAGPITFGSSMTSVYTAGDQTYTGNLTIKSNILMNASTTGNVTLGSVDSNAAGTNVLTINTDTGAINLNGNVGSNFALNSVTAETTNNNVSVSNNITTSGTGDTISLIAGGSGNLLTIGGSATVSGDTITYQADHMVLTGSTNVNNGSNFTLQPFTNAYPIQVGATASDVSALGLTTTELGTIHTTGGLIFGSGNYSGDISVTGGLILAKRFTFTTTTGTVNIASGIGSVGTPVTSLTVNAASTNLDGNIYANGNTITFNSPVVLTGNSTVNDAGNITYNNTINGPWTLADTTSGGAVTYNNTIGNSSALTSLTTSGNTGVALNTGTVTTVGAQNYTGVVTLGTNVDITTTNSPVTFNNNVLSNGINNSSPEILSLSTGSGDVTFDGTAGSTTNRLQTLTITNTGNTNINGGGVWTVEGQGYDNLTLSADTTFDSSAGSVNFADSVDGAHALVANSSTGVTFGGIVGGGSPLTSLIVNGATSITGGAITTTTFQTYNSPVTLGATTALNGGNITTTDINNSGFGLTVNTSGNSNIGGVLSGAGSLTLSGSGTLTLAGMNTYMGATNINAGTLSISAGNNINTSSPLHHSR